MSTLATVAQGTTIAIGNAASPEVFTTIAEIADFQGPDGQVTVIDASHLDSGTREKIVGLLDNGQFSFNCNFLPQNTQQLLLRTNRAAKTITNFQVTFTDAGTTTFAFAAIIVDFVAGGQVDDKLTASVTLEITGAITES